MQQAAAYQFPNQLRNLFVMLLLHCQIADPIALFEKFERQLMEDLLYKVNNRPNEQPVNGSAGK